MATSENLVILGVNQAQAECLHVGTAFQEQHHVGQVIDFDLARVSGRAPELKEVIEEVRTTGRPVSVQSLGCFAAETPRWYNATFVGISPPTGYASCYVAYAERRECPFVGKSDRLKEAVRPYFGDIVADRFSSPTLGVPEQYRFCRILMQDQNPEYKPCRESVQAVIGDDLIPSVICFPA